MESSEALGALKPSLNGRLKALKPLKTDMRGHWNSHFGPFDASQAWQIQQIHQQLAEVVIHMHDTSQLMGTERVALGP